MVLFFSNIIVLLLLDGYVILAKVTGVILHTNNVYGIGDFLFNQIMTIRIFC